MFKIFAFTQWYAYEFSLYVHIQTKLVGNSVHNLENSSVQKVSYDN